MRTAEEIITEAKQKCDGWGNKHRYNEFVLAIQIARKEAIEECAKVARAETIWYNNEAQAIGLPKFYDPIIDKERILSLINKLQ